MIPIRWIPVRAQAALFGLVVRQADNDEALEQIKPLLERREKANEKPDDDLNLKDLPTYFSDGTLDLTEEGSQYY